MSKIKKEQKYNLSFRRKNSNIFCSCPCTNDLSESSIASAKFEKRRTPQADWETIANTTLLRRNNTIAYFKKLKMDNEKQFNQAMYNLSNNTSRSLQIKKNNRKKNYADEKKKDIKDKTDKQKTSLINKQNKLENALNTQILTIDEIEQKIKDENIKSTTKKMDLWKNQLKAFKIKYQTYNGCPEIMFSKDGKKFDDITLKELLKTCFDWYDKNQIDEKEQFELPSVGSKRSNKDIFVQDKNSKRIRVLTVPNILYDCNKKKTQ